MTDIKALKFKKVKATQKLDKLPDKMKIEVDKYKDDIVNRFGQQTYEDMVNRKLARYEISKLLIEATKGEYQ